MSKLNNRALGIYLEMKPAEVRKIFDPIAEAFEEVNLAMPKMEMADLYSKGTLPTNWGLYLDRLDARKVISEADGVSVRDAELILKSGYFDAWVLLQSACNSLLGEELPEDFEELVIKPGKSYLKIGEDEIKRNSKMYVENFEAIKRTLPEIQKAVKRMAKNEKYFANGGEIHSAYIYMNRIIEIVEIIEERAKS